MTQMSTRSMRRRRKRTTASSSSTSRNYVIVIAKKMTVGAAILLLAYLVLHSFVIDNSTSNNDTEKGANGTVGEGFRLPGNKLEFARAMRKKFGRLSDTTTNTSEKHGHHGHGRGRGSAGSDTGIMANTDPQDLFDFVESIRKPMHPLKGGLWQGQGSIVGDNRESGNSKTLSYDINDCPEVPPQHYPMEWSLMDIINHWNPNDTDSHNRRVTGIHQGLCRFDFMTEMHKIVNYRKAELPFLIRDDPAVLEVVKRWNSSESVMVDDATTSTGDVEVKSYLSSILGDTKYRTEYSETNSLMYFMAKKGKGKRGGPPKDWSPPLENIAMTYDEWLEKAMQSPEDMAPNMPHWYFRVSAKGSAGKVSRNDIRVRKEGSKAAEAHAGDIMFEELPFFKSSSKSLYMVDPKDARGINCRFGMMGNTAAAHFDGSRNFVMLFGGERRYILSHPKNCPNLGLYPRGHPSGRHTAVDWSDPDLEQFPQFAEAYANEVVLQAGDVLYLPTAWFHHIISLDLNWQCNARSGITDTYKHHIEKCGFN
uniref:JmjC domain-containing protein n=1 Tax=Chaetoceros debilis TaxID=122233 RepID=A0A7S3PYN6_9STRA|mmetsp:Transcript_25931/g.39739  ORF Transcript_25931/g.39739 Transcript_25931/m.39739 type:complete len:536 (+) Transcript_25931:148-1755(+)